jgi:hypothetical protein
MVVIDPQCPGIEPVVEAAFADKTVNKNASRNNFFILVVLRMGRK